MIDLHMHTTASDGNNTPAEVLQFCEDAGLEMISVTDHWTMLGYDEILKPEVRSLFSGRILPGCEFTANFKGQGMEILGYGVHPEDAREYLSHFPALPEKRKIELEELIRVLGEKGMRFDEAAVRSTFESGVTDARGSMWREIRNYPENVALFTDPESATNSHIFSRRELANRTSPFFVHNKWFSPPADEVCEFIRSLGGKAIIAHPLSYSAALTEELEELIEFAKPDGLEVWYSTFTAEQREFLRSLCKKYDLIFSGGSDYHDEARKDRGNIIGIPQFADIFPTGEILKWADQLKMV